MTHLLRSRSLRGAVAAAAGALLLSACSHAPGAAIQVGDQRVERSDVNTFVDVQCTFAGEAVKAGQAQAAPRSAMVWQVVNQMLDATTLAAYAEAHDTTYDEATLRKQVSQVAPVIDGLPDDQQDSVRDSVDLLAKGRLIGVALGADQVKSQGSGDAQTSDDQAYSVGLNIARKWAEKQGIAVDPRYNLGARKQAGAGDGSISRPTSSFAKAAAKGEGQQAFLALVGSNQRCG